MAGLRLSGLVAAPHTPFDSTGRLNLPVVSRQVAHLDRMGVTGAFVGGTTGEGLSLSVTERTTLAEHWVASARECVLQIVVQVGHNNLGDARALAAHAQTIGAHAIAAFAPSFFRPSSPGALAGFLGEIARAAPDLPFYYYEIPAFTGVRIPVADVLPELARTADRFHGIKYTGSDLAGFLQCVRFDEGRLNVLYGCDESLLAGLALGAEGAVGSSYNFAAPLYHRLIRRFEDGRLDEARREQLRSVELIRVLERFGYPAAAKSVMGFLGIDCGPVRPPLDAITSESRRELERELRALGFFEWGIEVAQPR